MEEIETVGLTHSRLEYLFNLAQTFSDEHPALSRSFMQQLVDLAKRTETRLSWEFFERVCQGCGTIFKPSKNCQVKCWIGHRLRRALKGPFGQGHKFLISSKQGWPLSAAAMKKNVKGGGVKYVLVYRCDCCRTHTVFDRHGFDDPKVAAYLPEIATPNPSSAVARETKVDMAGTVRAAAAQNKKLQQFLAKKKKQKQPTTNESTDDLSSFLLGL